MRKIIITVLMLFSTAFVYATFDSDNPEQHTIIIKSDKPELPTGSTKPLSLVSDIEASYYDGALTLVFNADLGDAEILVVNLATGDSWNESVSGAGVATLLLSGEEGYYEILIHTDNGDYSGEFTL